MRNKVGIYSYRQWPTGTLQSIKRLHTSHRLVIELECRTFLSKSYHCAVPQDAANAVYLYSEPMLDEGIVQVDESQKMAHRREHALADMISGNFSLHSNRAVGEIGGSHCKVAVTTEGHQQTLGICLLPTRRS